MNKDRYDADVQMLIRQNRFLWFTNAAVLAALILVLLIAWNGMGANRTIVVPPKIEKTFWITDNAAAGEYIDQMGQWVSYLTLDVTPDNVEYKSSRGSAVSAQWRQCRSWLRSSRFFSHSLCLNVAGR
jgi:conjugal transfer pilus assembly protein TraE